MAHHRRLIILAGITGLLGVALGAFGSHGLGKLLEANGRTATFDTGVQYHLIHALAILLVAVLQGKALSGRAITWAGYLFLAGILLFSGSLYILAIFNVTIMGAIAPIGGTAFILGWGCIAWAGYKANS